MNANKTLANFDPGARVRMLSGPYAGRTGKRDQYLSALSKMILVKFDGDTSFSMVANSDACQSAADPVPVITSESQSRGTDAPVPAPAKRGRKPKSQLGAQA